MIAFLTTCIKKTKFNQSDRTNDSVSKNKQNLSWQISLNVLFLNVKLKWTLIWI